MKNLLGMLRKKSLLPINILLADDDIDDRAFFEQAIKEISNEIILTTVQDGEQLMELLSEKTQLLPDILFLDLSMPRKNGFECLTEIKENKSLNDMPVVMFSTSYERDLIYEKSMIELLYNIGAQSYIRKPDNILQLKENIEKALIKHIAKDRIIYNRPS